MTTERVLTWDVMASRGYETAWTVLTPDALRARGRAVGTLPEPYWVSYVLDTAGGYVTRRLTVTTETADRTRTLDLRHDGHGRWTADGRPLPEVDGALDCDLGLCPLTNSMPVLRHGLHRAGGEREFLMAWVSVPDLTVRPSRQTYTPLGETGDDLPLGEGGEEVPAGGNGGGAGGGGAGGGGAGGGGAGGGGAGRRIRYASGSFRSDVLFDADGFVADYPQLATRLG